AEEIERAGRRSGRIPRPGSGQRGTTEGHQTRLLRMEGQTVFGETLGDHFHHAPRVRLVSETNHEIVREPDQERVAPQAGLYLVEEPFVQHIVQVDVRQHGGNHATLGAAILRIRPHSVLHHPRVQPLADQSQEYAVAYSSAKQVPKHAVVQRV